MNTYEYTIWFYICCYIKYNIQQVMALQTAHVLFSVHIFFIMYNIFRNMGNLHIQSKQPRCQPSVKPNTMLENIYVYIYIYYHSFHKSPQPRMIQYMPYWIRHHPYMQEEAKKYTLRLTTFETRAIVILPQPADQTT